MRIAFISTYPPIECGIGTYTQFLTDIMEKTPNEVNIISQHGAYGPNVFPAYNQGETGIGKKIFEMTAKMTPDLVHIQHEFALYGESEGISVLDLIHRFRLAGTPVVATCHTVFAEPTHEQHYVMTAMGHLLDGIIVHEKSHSDLLQAKYGLPAEKVHVVPHGAREMERVPDAKKKLDLEGKKIILVAGYFRPTKCFEKVVDAFPAILEKVPNARLVIAGKLRRLLYSDYRSMLFRKIDASPARDHIEIFRGQFPQQTYDTILSAADVLVFPYSIGAQSGVMAHAFTFGIPVVTSNLPAFRRVLKESDAGRVAVSDDDYVTHITRILQDETLAGILSNNGKKYVKECVSWRIVARKHLEIYQKYRIRLETKSRYVYVG